MKKSVKKAIEAYELWVLYDRIYTQWEDPDFDNTVIYENINGDYVYITRDDNGKIIDAGLTEL